MVTEDHFQNAAGARCTDEEKALRNPKHETPEMTKNAVQHADAKNCSDSHENHKSLQELEFTAGCKIMRSGANAPDREDYHGVLNNIQNGQQMAVFREAGAAKSEAFSIVLCQHWHQDPLSAQFRKALEACIKAHGPITRNKSRLDSAVKRLYGVLKALSKRTAADLKGNDMSENGNYRALWAYLRGLDKRVSQIEGAASSPCSRSSSPSPVTKCTGVSETASPKGRACMSSDGAGAVAGEGTSNAGPSRANGEGPAKATAKTGKGASPASRDSEPES